MMILLNCHSGTQTLEEHGNLDQLNYLYIVIHPILLALHRHSCLVILVLRVLPLAWERVYLLSLRDHGDYRGWASSRYSGTGTQGESIY